MARHGPRLRVRRLGLLRRAQQGVPPLGQPQARSELPRPLRERGRVRRRLRQLPRRP
jgi:hypothetical protein